MLQQIAEWKSIRKFSAEPVSDEKLITIMQAGRRAPSWKNIQPWRFIALTGAEDKQKLGEGFSMGSMIKKAPAVILCVGRLSAWEEKHQHQRLKELLANTGVDMADEEIDKVFLKHDIAKALAASTTAITARVFENMGIAYGFMIMEAMNQGLGACIVGEIDNELSGVNNEKYAEIKRYFSLEESDIITAAIILGYPAKPAATSPRKPEDEVFSIRR